MEAPALQLPAEDPKLGLFRIGRATALALAVVLIGSSAYAAFAWRNGVVRQFSDPDNPRLRCTSVDFSTWWRIIPAADWPECSYQEIQLPSGEWVKHGAYGRRTREGAVSEHGTYSHGQRAGRWTYWDHRGAIDLERSGVYRGEVRVKPGPTSHTDPTWWRGSEGS
jgi:hypothetical protein